MLRNIREISIIGDFHQYGAMIPTADEMAAMWDPLVDLVRKTARLTKVDYDYGAAKFPLLLLDALQTCHPRVKLCIWNYGRDEEMDHTDEAEKALAISPILRSIKTSVWTNGSEPDIDLRLPAFRRILAKAPNLKFASITTGHSGCMVQGQSVEGLARERQAAAHFTSASDRPNTSIRSLTLDGFGLNQKTLHEWGKYVSLSHLESLKCSRGLPEISYFELAPTLLPNLKHVSLNLCIAGDRAVFENFVDNYLASCAPLETLSLWGWMGLVMLDTILKHGPTLKTLQLHERETMSLQVRRELLTTDDLRRIREECPQLEDLTFDTDREDADYQKDLLRHQEMLGELARFGRRLRKLQIYLDLGIANEITGLVRPRQHLEETEAMNSTQQEAAETDPDSTTSTEYYYRGPFPPPPLDSIKDHGARVWQIVFGDPTHRGPRELHIKWGECERKLGPGYPARWVLWERRNMKHIMIRPQERDDRPGEAVVRVFRDEGGGLA